MACVCTHHEGIGFWHLEVLYEHYETSCSTQTQKERSAELPANILFKQIDSLTYIIPLSRVEYCAWIYTTNWHEAYTSVASLVGVAVIVVVGVVVVAAVVVVVVVVAVVVV